jgi:hypothetical protein
MIFPVSGGLAPFAAVLERRGRQSRRKSCVLCGIGGADVRVETRVYFAVASDELSPAQLTDRIGMQPSAALEKGSRRPMPPMPATSAWKLDSGLDRDAPLTDHLDALLVLIALLADKISELCEGESAARLQIVREFRSSEGEVGLGFALDERWLQVLSQTRAFVDVDEYDFALG